MTGLKFYSLEELQDYIIEKEKTDSIRLYVQQSRTIEAARRKGVKRIIKDNLKYYEIIFKCIHGGHCISKATGQRKVTSRRFGCPFYLRIRPSADGNYLEIFNLNDIHNHKTTQVQDSVSAEEYQEVTVKKEVTEDGDFLQTSNEHYPVISKVPNEISTSKSVKRKRSIEDEPVTNTRIAKHSLSSRKSVVYKHQKDEYDVFGDTVACCLRKLSSNFARIVVKHEINNVLFQAELGQYDTPSESMESVISQVLTVATSSYAEETGEELIAEVVV